MWRLNSVQYLYSEAGTIRERALTLLQEWEPTNEPETDQGDEIPF